ncbi:MAG: hypothetical protein HXY29_14025 [Rhodocyclaceae bacterium]|nr:hypothetical protein [Rhodocyclaceae bacterium]
MANWDNCSSQCINCVDGIGYSAPISLSNGDYCLVLLNASGRITDQLYKQVFSDTNIDISDEIIIFCHEYKEGHPYGSKIEDFQCLRKIYKNLEFYLFPGEAPNKERNYPFWVVTQINNYPRQKDLWIPSWDELKRSQSKGPTLVKYRIAHLFLPFHIDFQALEIITNENRKREYAKEVIKEYQDRRNGNSPFLQLLADLQFLVAKEDEIKFDSGITIATSLSDKDLPDEKCLKELIEEAELQSDRLKEFCKSLGFNENTWVPTPTVIDFFEALDKAVICNSPDCFLEAIGKKINGKDFDQWFVQWFAQLEELIDRLEGGIGAQ